MHKLVITLLFISTVIMAQPPDAFTYQAVVRNSSGELIVNQPVSFRTSIRDGSPAGTIIYQETHQTITNTFGLANLLIGEGSPVTGSFSTIDWGAGDRYLQTECDPQGGTAWVILGTTKLQSVPYALFAGRSYDSHWESNGNKIFYSNGYVGIGTSDPEADFHVFGGGLFKGSEAGMYFSPASASSIIGYSSPTYNVSRIILSENCTRFNGNVAIGASDPSFAAFQIQGGGIYSGIIRLINTGTNGSDFFIGSTNDSWGAGGGRFVIGPGQPSTAYTAFTIDNAGKVGIGETEPAYRLHVKGPDYNTWLAGFHNTNTSSTANGVVIRADGGDPLLVQNASGTIINAKQSQYVGIHTSSPSTNLVVKSSGYTHGLHVLASDDDLIFRVRQNSDGSGSAFLYNGSGIPGLVLSPVGITYFLGGNVGIGTESPNNKLEVRTESSNGAIYGFSTNGAGVNGSSVTSYGIFGQSTTGYAGYFSGNVHVGGSLSKGAGSFVIDHPLDPENKLLRHNFVESPENLLIYRGKILLDNKGEATVAMPEYFAALTNEAEATVILTSVGKPFLTGYEWAEGHSMFTVIGESSREVSWVVYADRDDPVIHELGRPVEEEKGPDNKLCDKGQLLFPSAYGYPEKTGRACQITHSQNNFSK
ncbi:MAG: hypothetical protein JXA03_07250 [Bacteroidales bacterium]|nr:hypothetical protein [Bacteroidales bacterium]